MALPSRPGQGGYGGCRRLIRAKQGKRRGRKRFGRAGV